MRESATLTSTARPRAPPIMNAVLTIPEASPLSVGATSPMAASSSGLKVIPPPIPMTSMAGSTSTTKLPSAGARANQSRPMAKHESPATIGGFTPKRITSRSESAIEPAAMISVDGR